MEEYLKQCRDSVLEGDRARAVALAEAAIREGYALLEVIDRGFSEGIRRAGELWEEGEYFLPELAFSAEAMKAAMQILQPALLESRNEATSRGTVIIGTVQGDIHDIGKTLVATMLSSSGYRVHDLGADVAHTSFVEEAARQAPCFLCMSALLTTTMVGQRRVIELLGDHGLRDRVRVIVGGAPTNAEWAKEIGADGFAHNAIDAVRVLDSLRA
jgi:corrinoid protein of di/trimethylamine methyltransferase